MVNIQLLRFLYSRSIKTPTGLFELHRQNRKEGARWAWAPLGYLRFIDVS